MGNLYSFGRQKGEKRTITKLAKPNWFEYLAP